MLKNQQCIFLKEMLYNLVISGYVINMNEFQKQQYISFNFLILSQYF